MAGQEGFMPRIRLGTLRALPVVAWPPDQIIFALILKGDSISLIKK